MRILSTIHPTSNQKRVLAKIAAAPTATVAASEISSDANLVAARNMLMKLGLIALVNGEASMTERGARVSVEENIVDDAGELTQAGQELAHTNVKGQPDNDTAGAKPTVESFSLLKELLR